MKLNKMLNLKLKNQMSIIKTWEDKGDSVELAFDNDGKQHKRMHEIQSVLNASKFFFISPLRYSKIFSPPFFAIALLKTYTLARTLMPAAAAICTRASVAVLSAVVRAARPAVDRRPSLLLSMLPGERTGFCQTFAYSLSG